MSERLPTDDPMSRVSKALGYEFRDLAPLRVALTHRSYTNEYGANAVSPRFGPDNERLEFLGDAVLGLVISEILWSRVPEAREGELSRLRAAIVNEASLAEAARQAGIGEALRLGRGEERGGGRTRPSILADALEAVFAAVYLDGGIDAARAVISRALAPRIDEVVTRGVRDFKTTLQELLQARHRITPRYEVVATHGPDHDRTYEVELRADNVVSARGSGRSKKEAEQAAARLALESLESSEAHARDGAPAGEVAQ